jgi:hypothetical protein
MPPRVAGIPHHRERASLQSIKDRNWVIQADLHPAGEGTIASMLRKGWIERQLGPGGAPTIPYHRGGQGCDCRQNSVQPLRPLNLICLKIHPPPGNFWPARGSNRLCTTEKSNRMMLEPTPELPDETLISDVEFPTRIRTVLAAAGLETVGEVRETSDEILLSFQDFGKTSIAYLRETLGLSSTDGVRPLVKKPA